MCYPSRETSVDQFLQEIVNILHGHDRGARTASDPDWLEINGNPTIPPVQSIRAPPAPIALHAEKDNMLGITNKNVSRKYLEKLQKDRERNQEVLAECIDKLPITIKQLVYPEKPRYGSVSSNQSRDTKFRIGRANDFWQETADQWVNEDSDSADLQSVPNHHNKHHNHVRNGVRENSHHSRSTSDSAFVNKDFVHYPGFQGSSGQSQSLKYRYGKKKSGISSDSSTKQRPAKFKPKGYGSLYDELEFERRYKKVFDLNKHIHFVHSNFLSGQRLMKKSRLPPLGYNSSIQSDPMDPGDIFAIMSVQKFNHPEDIEKSRLTLSNPGSGFHRTEGPYDCRANKPRLEVTQSLDTPVGFVPGSIPKTGSSPFDGVNGANNEINQNSVYRLQNMTSDDRDQSRTNYTVSTFDDNKSESQRNVANKRKPEDEKRKSRAHKKVPQTQSSVRSTDIGSEVQDDTEPFNIRVHVEIRPTKDNELKESSDNASPPSDPGLFNEGNNFNLNHMQDEHDADGVYENDTFEEKIVYPTKLESFGDNIVSDVDKENSSEAVIKPRNITISTNQFGFITKKVQYPQNFVLDNNRKS